MTTEVVERFLREHFNADLDRLLFQGHQHPELDVQYLVSQIQALRVIQKKCPLWFDFRLRFPPKVSLEQASSAASAEYKASLLSGKKALDLTGGLGIDSFYFSKRFDQLVYVERQEELTELASHNFKVLGQENMEVVHAEAEDFLHKTKEEYDLIYLDPSRRGDLNQRLRNLRDCSPSVPDLHDVLLEKGKNVLVKAAPLLDISNALKELPSCVHAWVIAVKNEVKELLFLLQREPAPLRITAIDLEWPSRSFTFSPEEEGSSDSEYSPVLNYLYEPGSAVLKSGAFRLFGARNGLKKLQQHTHLYTSEQLVDGLQARAFRIKEKLKVDKKALKSHLPGGKANLAVRNFPLKATELQKKLGVIDGGDQYLFAFTDWTGKKSMVLTERVY